MVTVAASAVLSRYLPRSIEKGLSGVTGTRTTGSIFRLSMTSYGTPAAFAASTLITRVYPEETSGALTDRSEPESVTQPTCGSVVTDKTLSATGSFRNILRLRTKFLPAAEVISVAGDTGTVGPVMEPELVVVGSIVKLP